MRERYGVALRRFPRLMGPSPLDDYAEAYNRVSTDAIMRRYKRDILADTLIEVVTDHHRNRATRH